MATRFFCKLQELLHTYMYTHIKQALKVHVRIPYGPCWLGFVLLQLLFPFTSVHWLLLPPELCALIKIRQRLFHCVVYGLVFLL